MPTFGKHEDFTNVVITTDFEGTHSEYVVTAPTDLDADDGCDFCMKPAVYEIIGDQANCEVSVLYCQSCIHTASEAVDSGDTFTRPLLNSTDHYNCP